MVLFANIHLGQRVEVFWNRGALRGTVRFKGSIASKRGDWVGIALDKPCGENNGTVSGHRYFQCRDKHGIFVRAEKIRFIPTVRCLYDKYHKVSEVSYVEEPLFTTPISCVTNGPYEPILLSSRDFTRARSFAKDYSPTSLPWVKSSQFHRSHSVSRSFPAATMLRPQTAQASFRYRSTPIHTQYSIDDDFVSKPVIPKIHMPHSALIKQVKRGWKDSHYVREMSVATGRDEMKFCQWNDISP